MTTSIRTSAFVAACVGVLLEAPHAGAFPPYRSTDAETADPWDLEGRLGLIRYTRDAGKNGYASPLLRVNFGLPQRVELTGEFEYLPTDGEVGDAAAGFKWVPYFHDASLGIEVLALLPVSSDGGAGVESQLLATQRWAPYELHLNAGGFYDARPSPEEKGFRASVLGEVEIDRFRPGVEVFARQFVGEPVAVEGGVGVIVKLGPIDLRTGVHAGVTQVAPDFRASCWVAGKLPLAGSSSTGVETD